MVSPCGLLDDFGFAALPLGSAVRLVSDVPSNSEEVCKSPPAAVTEDEVGGRDVDGDGGSDSEAVDVVRGDEGGGIMVELEVAAVAVAVHVAEVHVVCCSTDKSVDTVEDGGEEGCDVETGLPATGSGDDVVATDEVDIHIVGMSSTSKGTNGSKGGGTWEAMSEYESLVASPVGIDRGGGGRTTGRTRSQTGRHRPGNGSRSHARSTTRLPSMA